MEGLLKQLSNLGPVVIRFASGYWQTACEVYAYEIGNDKQVTKSTGVNLYNVLRELLKQSTITRKRLRDKMREPKQGAFEYGSTSDYKENY